MEREWEDMEEWESVCVGGARERADASTRRQGGWENAEEAMEEDGWEQTGGEAVEPLARGAEWDDAKQNQTLSTSSSVPSLWQRFGNLNQATSLPKAVGESGVLLAPIPPGRLGLVGPSPQKTRRNPLQGRRGRLAAIEEAAARDVGNR